MRLISVPNLRAGETAYILDTGECVAVRIARGEETETQINLWLDARLVTPDGATVTEGGVECCTPRKQWAVLKDALAQGEATIEGVLERMAEDGCRRACAHAAGLKALAAIL